MSQKEAGMAGRTLGMQGVRAAKADSQQLANVPILSK
jgi:hypothetical protein